MKIGIVTYALNSGGVEIVIKTLATYFAKNGHNVDIIETSNIGIESNNFKASGFNVKAILIKPFETRNSYAKRLANELNIYDVLILNSVPFVHYLLGLLKKEIVVLPILHNDIKEFYEEILVNNSQWDKAICVSAALEKKLLNYKNLQSNKVVTIPNGVEVNSSYSLKNRDNTFTILFVGRIEDKQKGVLLLPKIIKKVIKNKDTNIKLKIIGNGPSLDELKKEINKYDLNNYIELTGTLPHKDVIEEMKKATLLIMPSYYEGQGLVYLEAMAQGLIPLVSNLKDNTNLVIKDGKNGFLCEIGDIECFANKITYLLEHKELIPNFSKEAYKTAKESLSSEVMVAKYEQLIKEIKSNKNTIRTNKLEKISFGNLPNILYQLIHLTIRVKNKIARMAKSGT